MSDDESGTPNLTIWTPPVPYAWANPNVWNVPGSDPNGPKGQPKVGSPNWCWANIANTGTATAFSTVVQFYYCTPNGPVNQWSDFLGNSAGQTKAIDLAPGGPIQVVASTSWSPPAPGHVCIIGYLSANNDPGPPQTPTIAPQITDRHVGQQNLTALQVTAGGTLSLDFLAHSDEGATVTVRQGDPADYPPAEFQVSGMSSPGAPLQVVNFGIVDSESRQVGATPLPVTRMELPPGSRILRLEAQIPDDAEPGQQALFEIRSTRGNQTLSGLSVLATVAAPTEDE